MMPRPRRRDVIWAAIVAVVLLLVGTVGWAAVTPKLYNCARTDRDGGFRLDCTTAPPSPTPRPSTTLTPSPSVSPTVQPSASSTPSATPVATIPSPIPSPSVSTSVSPTVPARPLNCWADPVACGYPGPGTTGVPAGTVLTASTGDVEVRTDGTVIDGQDIAGCVVVHAANVVIRDSRIHGQCFFAVSSYEATNLLIEDSEISCPDARGTAVAGPNYVVRRSYLHGCENALEMGSNTTVTDSWLSAAEADSAGHGDGIQSQGGTNVVVRHNTILVGDITSSIITNPTLNNGWTVVDNFLGGGAFTVYCPEEGTGWVVAGNRFVMWENVDDTLAVNPYAARYGLVDACDHAGISWSSNYVDQTGAVVPAGGVPAGA